MTKLLSVTPSTRKHKKLMATFQLDDSKTKKVHFGDSRYRDYTKIEDNFTAALAKTNYWSRHGKEDNGPVDSPAMLSLYILWGPHKTVSANVTAYKKRFHL